jgi:hypothetical protein
MFRTAIAVCSAAVLAVSTPARADPPEGFVERVEQLREHSGAPGIAVAIVEQGETTLAQGWGVRKLGEPARVDADTIFPTGSTGKAFTTAALATLVDQGRIGWDDKVIDHIPWFRMYDPWVATCSSTAAASVSARAICSTFRAPASPARKRSSGCATSSRQPASVRTTPTTTSSTSSPAS